MVLGALEGERVASVFDAIKAFRGRSCNPREEYKRLAERYPEVATTCDNLQFSGAGQRETPVANAKTLVCIPINFIEAPERSDLPNAIQM